MANQKKKFIKMRVEEECAMSRDELVEKLDGIIDTQYRRNLNKLRGNELCLWSKAAEDSYRLKFYHSYREDMCDTMMTIDIEKGMERCSIHGFIHKPAAIWACFWGVIASVLIDFMVLSWMLLFSENFSLEGGLMVSGAICLVRVYICMALLELNREKVRLIREELYSVIRHRPGDDAEETANDSAEEEEENEGD